MNVYWITQNQVFISKNKCKIVHCLFNCKAKKELLHDERLGFETMQPHLSTLNYQKYVKNVYE